MVLIAAELAAQAIATAVNKDRGESTVRDELARGGDIAEVFDPYRIL